MSGKLLTLNTTSSFFSVCAIKMGIENFLIVGKPQLTASSSKESHAGASYGRLNEGEKKPTAWIPS